MEGDFVNLLFITFRFGTTGLARCDGWCLTKLLLKESWDTMLTNKKRLCAFLCSFNMKMLSSTDKIAGACACSQYFSFIFFWGSQPLLPVFVTTNRKLIRN